jgi:hypothetical protein
VERADLFPDDPYCHYSDYSHDDGSHVSPPPRLGGCTGQISVELPKRSSPFQACRGIRLKELRLLAELVQSEAKHQPGDQQVKRTWDGRAQHHDPVIHMYQLWHLWTPRTELSWRLDSHRTLHSTVRMLRPPRRVARHNPHQELRRRTSARQRVPCGSSWRMVLARTSPSKQPLLGSNDAKISPEPSLTTSADGRHAQSAQRSHRLQDPNISCPPFVRHLDVR